MATYVDYAAVEAPAIQTGHPNFAYLGDKAPLFSQQQAGPAGHFPAPVAQALQGGTIGSAYSETISSGGGTAPYSFSLTGGSLPTGISLSTDGIISGTPSAAGMFSFTVRVMDANGNSGSQTFTIVVAAPPPPANYGYVA